MFFGVTSFSPCETHLNMIIPAAKCLGYTPTVDTVDENEGEDVDWHDASDHLVPQCGAVLNGQMWDLSLLSGRTYVHPIHTGEVFTLTVCHAGQLCNGNEVATRDEHTHRHVQWTTQA